ncbi:MAG TPA: phosphoglycolate phosphatase [Dokdonella sp.]|uniref:phosphoglycolate phosphatase n=1 Tax=Dokdonella sp. TaxID=2291710 RepID=UPI002CBCC34F|nr:phosphoglycolate phosphatase [Dokdonella sp.]HUD43584.1 phosphoglycolate phosphatase [Dokdonella sp.]
MTTPLDRPIRGVLFDLDGTLVDSLADIHAAVAMTLAELGLPVPDAATVRGYIGHGVRTLLERALTGALGHAPDAALTLRAEAVFDPHYAAQNGRTARLYPGVREGLAAFAARGLPMAVVTNKPQRFSEALLARLGVAGRFATVIGGDVAARRKPHADPLLLACARIGVAPAEALMIGDSAIDAAAADAAGTALILVGYGYHHEAPLDPATCIVDRIDAIAALLDGPAPRTGTG